MSKIHYPGVHKTTQYLYTWFLMHVVKEDKSISKGKQGEKNGVFKCFFVLFCF